MAKHTLQMKDPSGDNPLYESKYGLVRMCSSFIYEVCLYKYWKNGFCQLDSKFYKSSHILHIKKDNTIIKYKDFFIEKEISLIGVPKAFIEEFNLKYYKPEVLIKKRKKK